MSSDDDSSDVKTNTNKNTKQTKGEDMKNEDDDEFMKYLTIKPDFHNKKRDSLIQEA